MRHDEYVLGNYSCADIRIGSGWRWSFLIYNSMNENADKWAKENIDSIINECEESIQSLRSEKEQSKLIDVKLRQLLKRIETLIDEIQSDDIKVNLQKES